MTDNLIEVAHAGHKRAGQMVLGCVICHQECLAEIERLRADCEAIEKRKIRYAQAAGEAREVARTFFETLRPISQTLLPLEEWTKKWIEKHSWLENKG